MYVSCVLCMFYDQAFVLCTFYIRFMYVSCVLCMFPMFPMFYVFYVCLMLHVNLAHLACRVTNGTDYVWQAPRHTVWRLTSMTSAIPLFHF